MRRTSILMGMVVKVEYVTKPLHPGATTKQGEQGTRTKRQAGTLVYTCTSTYEVLARTMYLYIYSISVSVSGSLPYHCFFCVCVSPRRLSLVNCAFPIPHILFWLTQSQGARASSGRVTAGQLDMRMCKRMLTNGRHFGKIIGTQQKQKQQRQP